MCKKIIKWIVLNLFVTFLVLPSIAYGSSVPKNLKTGLYSYGWSKDGKCAVIQLSNWDDVSGAFGYKIEIIIVNAVNDKVLWKYEKTSEDFYNIDEEGNTKKVPQSTLDKALRSLFETGVKEATPSFKQYKIDMNIQKFKNLPDTINGSEYSAEIKILKYINHGEDELTEARKYGEIWLYSSKHGKKKLTDFVFEGVRAREVKGGRYTKSPYEKRILINFYGYGSFMDGFYIDERFTGADLTTRFKKD